MKAINHFEQNRPVHLARRDVFFEHAVELLLEPDGSSTAELDLAKFEEILFLLRISRRHAGFSIRETGKNAKDELFERLIILLTGNVKAVLSMLNLKAVVTSSDGSFFSFLGANQASVALQAEEYERRANDIARSILNTLRLAEEPFAQLKNDYVTSTAPENLERYEKARAHFAEGLRRGDHLPLPPRAR